MGKKGRAGVLKKQDFVVIFFEIPKYRVLFP